MRYEMTKPIKAGWCEGGPGDQVDLDEFQAAALRAHHGEDCLKEVSPAAETPQDHAPAAGSESPGNSSSTAPAGAPPLEDGEDDLDEADEDLDEEDRSAGGTAGTGEPLNRMVSHSGRGGGGKKGAAKKGAKGGSSK